MTGSVAIHQGDNLAVARRLPDAAFAVVYLDPPFNTGRTRTRLAGAAPDDAPGAARDEAGRQADGEVAAGRMQDISPASLRLGPAISVDERDPAGTSGSGRTGVLHAGHAGPGSDAAPDRHRGFRGREYVRLRGDLGVYDDSFDDYWGFLEPRLLEAWRLLADDGTLYLHLDYREVHYAKVLLDALFGRERFLNEIVWAYDYGAKSRRRWPTKHETILVYVKDPDRYWFDADAVDREPYMAPGLVTPEKAARGKLPTDVWWHTIVPTTGRERTGYPTQKPEGILRRIVQASSRPGDTVLDLFAGSGTTGAVAAALGRDALLVDDNPEAISVMRARLPHAVVFAGP
ncbi:site-specific DNA-methyltransferase [Microbacterium sp. 18062]|uniref:DNA-methyltransferase n=1 Tax=Microbacterium sp. 18062 TaxID=2681410 RepID=UPI001357D4D1|nr:site-specific DNA-methyltransferase [Microbacterium sp. 18062]